MTGGMKLGPCMGDDPFLGRTPALFLRTAASLMWNCSPRSLKNRSRMTAALSSNATSSPL